MTKNTFFIKALLSTFTFLGLFFIINTYVDPYKNLNMPWVSNIQTEDNPYLTKMNILKSFEPLELLIVGSSTSVPFSPKIVSKTFLQKSFSGSIIGSLTLPRLAIIRQALKSNRLRTILYVTDFFEFNNITANSKYLYQKQFTKNIQDYIQLFSKPNSIERIKDFIHHKVLRQSLRALFLNKNSKSYYKPDGSMTKSSIIKNDKDFKTAVYRNYVEHTNGILANFNRLSPNTIKMYNEISSYPQSHPNLQVIFITAPYHPLILERFKTSNKNLVELQKKWKNFIVKLGEKPNVISLDITNSTDFFPASGEQWVDGVHLSRKSAETILQLIKKKK